MRTLLAAALALALVQVAGAHDIYRDLREGYSATGPLCCGGDPVTGDCEGIWHDAYHITPAGDLVLWSNRYKVYVRVPANQVVYLHIPDPKNHPVHWCGKPLGDPHDPNTDWKTFCAFVSPGGV
jgi:hypothetical protein